jgi:predicted N-acetyltransferase YhbS
VNRKKLMTTIRQSRDSDVAAIGDVHREAFDPEQGREIVDLMNGLLADETARPILSLVAEVEGRIVGHVLFSAVRIPGAYQHVRAQILAPLAVLPSFQGLGVGGALIREGLGQLSATGVGLVFVLGHPAYYPRFGFQAAGRLGLTAPYPIPREHQEAWMVQELKPGQLGVVRGEVSCARTLDSPEHW